MSTRASPQTPASANFGNVTTPIFGQTTELTSLLANYGIRGTSVYSKALLTASVAPWLDFYGQFLYSDPDTKVNYQQAATGNSPAPEPIAVLYQPAISGFLRGQTTAHHWKFRSGDAALPPVAHH